MDLSPVKTIDLLKELASRQGVEKVSAGTGRHLSCELRRPYGRTRERIEANTVLVIKDLSHLDA